MALDQMTEDPRLAKARARRQTRMSSTRMGVHEPAPHPDWTPTPEEEAGRRLNNIPQSPALDVAHLLTTGANFLVGGTPNVKGSVAGIAAALRGERMGPAYNAAHDEEAAGLAALHENAPKSSFGLEMLGSAAVPLGGGGAVAERFAGRYAPAAARAVGAEAARVAAPEVAAQVARQATLRALPIGQRGIARAIGGAAAMAPVGAYVGALDTEGGLKERAIGAGKTAAAFAAGGAVLEPLVGAGGDAWRAVRGVRADDAAAGRALAAEERMAERQRGPADEAARLRYAEARARSIGRGLEGPSAEQAAEIAAAEARFNARQDSPGPVTYPRPATAPPAAPAATSAPAVPVPPPARPAPRRPSPAQEGMIRSSIADWESRLQDPALSRSHPAIREQIDRLKDQLEPFFVPSSDAQLRELADAMGLPVEALTPGRPSPVAEIPPPERPPVVSPDDPLSARFRGLRRADELAPPPRPQGPTMVAPAHPEPIARPVETPEERVARLSAPAAPQEPSGLILPPPRRPLTPRAPEVAEAAAQAREAVDASRLARDAGEVAAPPPEFTVTPRDFPAPPARAPLGKVGEEPPLSEAFEQARRRASGQVRPEEASGVREERVPFRDVVTPERPAPAPPPTVVETPRPPAPPAKVVASSTEAEDLDALAKFAHESRIPGIGDPLDEHVAAARIKRLPPADRATVRAKIKALAAASDQLNRGQAAAPTTLPDPLASLPPRLRERVQPVLEAKTEAELFAAASNLQDAKMSAAQAELVSKAIAERRATLPKAEPRPQVEAPAAPAAPTGPRTSAEGTIFEPKGEPKPLPAPLSTAEDKAAAEVRRQQRLAKDQGKRLGAEETVRIYEAALEQERKLGGPAASGGAPEAAPEPPFLEKEQPAPPAAVEETPERIAERARIADGTKKIGDTAAPPAPAAPKPATGLDAFTEGMEPKLKRRVEQTLGASIMDGSKQTTRQALVERKVAEGATVTDHPRDGRRLMGKDGNYIEEARLTKVAMDYAEHLAERRAAPPAADGLTPAERARWEAGENLPSSHPSFSGKAPPAIESPIVKPREAFVRPDVAPSAVGDVEGQLARMEAAEAPVAAAEPAAVEAISGTKTTTRPPLEGPVGHGTSIRFPDGKKRSAARWRIVEADAVSASHDPTNWSKNPDYPADVQQRHYDLDETAQQQFAGRLAQYDHTLPLDVTQEVVSGAPTVTPDGIVVGGNERTMLRQQVPKARPEAHAAYRRMLEEQAESLGFDPAEIAAMKDPFLVREIIDAPEDIVALRELNRRSDLNVGKAKDPVSDATTRARKFRDAGSALEHLAGEETAISGDETLRAYLRTSKGEGFVDALIADRVIEPNELAALRDPDTQKLTEQGANVIANMIEAAAVGDPRLASEARRLVPSVLNKMEHAFPALVQASTQKAWDLGKALQGALGLHIELASLDDAAKRLVKSIDDLIVPPKGTQLPMVPRADDPQAVALAKFLDDANKADVRSAMAYYASKARVAKASMESHELFPSYAPMTPEQAFQKAFSSKAPPVKPGTPAVQARKDAGFATLSVLRPIAGAGVGGMLGGTQGDTPEERAANALAWGLVGAGVAIGGEALLARRAGRAATPRGETFQAGVRRMFDEAHNYIRWVGGRDGEFLADGLQSIDIRSSIRNGALKADAHALVKGLTPEERVIVYKVADSRPSVRNAPERLRELGTRLRKEVTDVQRQEGADVGLTVTSKGKKVAPTAEAGHGFPQRPNAKGAEALNALNTIGTSDPRVQKMALDLVADGFAKSGDEAIERMQVLADELEGKAPNPGSPALFGRASNIESTRFPLPDDYVEWSMESLERAIERNSLRIEAAREWQPNGATAKTFLSGISREAGAKTARDIQAFLQHEFGVPGLGGQDPGGVFRAVSQYETIVRLGWSQLTKLRNSFQPFVNASRFPLSVQARAAKAYPPMVGEWFDAGIAAREWAERTGQVNVHTSVADVDKGSETWLATRSVKGFLRGESKNQTRAALISKFALEHDLERVMKAHPEKTSGLKQFLDVISGNDVRLDEAGKLAGAPARRLASLGIGGDALADIVASGRRLTAGEKAAAAYHFVHDTQFAMTLASKSVGLNRSPFLRSIPGKFKPFGVRQLQYVYKNVLREARHGNMAPLAKYMVASVIANEVYYIATDLAYGGDRSISVATAKNGALPDDTVNRLLKSSALGLLGMMMDMQYGISSWIGGPAVATLQNAGSALSASAHAFDAGQLVEQTPAIAGQFVQRESPAVRQVVGGVRRVLSVGMGNSPYFDYMSTRGAAFRHAGKADDDMAGFVDKLITGQQTFPTTAATAPMRSARTALYDGSPERAAKHIELALKTTDAAGVRSSLSRSAPLGGLSREARTAFLRSLPADERAKALVLQARWERDAARALAQATVKARVRK